MAQRQRAGAFGPGGERDQSYLVGGPTLELFAVWSFTPFDKKPKRPLDRLQAANGLALPIEVALSHAATAVHDHHNGDAFRRDPRPLIRPARPGQRDDEEQKGKGPRRQPYPLHQSAPTRWQGSEPTYGGVA